MDGDVRLSPAASRPAIIAHRGASSSAPENTLAAFAAAAEAGADGIELDVHLSADGVPVVIHNQNVDSTTSGSGKVNDLTLAQLQQLDAGTHFGPEFAGERIPSLAQVFAAFGDRLTSAGNRLWINVEIKPQPRHVTGLEIAVAELIHQFGLEDQVWVSSFKPHALSLLHRAAPEVGCALLYSPVTLTALLLLPITPSDAVHPHVSMVSRWFVNVAHRLDRTIVVWTVDNPLTAADLGRWGVDGVITNDPATARAAFGSGDVRLPYQGLR
jgi:glycerophosphoryl diester phosphodiesterase